MPDWERVAEDDPRRCQGTIPTVGQCPNKAMDGSDYCPAHGGNRAVETIKKNELKNYRLAKFKTRVTELGNSDHIFSLKEEIGILRMILEEKINACADVHDLILISGPLSDLVMKVDKITTSCERLESKLGNLLDRTKVMQFAQSIVQIISKHIEDDVILEQVADEILTVLEQNES